MLSWFQSPVEWGGYCNWRARGTITTTTSASFNPLSSGAVTATEIVDLAVEWVQTGFQSPVEWGGYCNVLEAQGCRRRRRRPVSIPCRVGRLLQHHRSQSFLYEDSDRFQSPVEWGGYCNFGVIEYPAHAAVMRFNLLSSGAVTATPRLSSTSSTGNGSFNPLSSGAVTATSLSRRLDDIAGLRVSIPCRVGRLLQRRRDCLLCGRLSNPFQSPVEWGGYCNELRDSLVDLIFQGEFQSPVEWGGYCNPDPLGAPVGAGGGFNPLSSGAVTATLRPLPARRGDGGRVSIPCRVGRLLQPEWGGLKAVDRAEFQSPVEWGGYCNRLRRLPQRSRRTFVSIPCRVGRLLQPPRRACRGPAASRVSIPCRVGRLLQLEHRRLDARGDLPEFQSPVEWGGYCNRRQLPRRRARVAARFNPLSSGAVTATSVMTRRTLVPQVRVSIPCRVGRLLQPRSPAACRTCGRAGFNPLSSGAVTATIGIAPSANVNPEGEFQSPVEWGGYCNFAASHDRQPNEVQVSIPCRVGRLLQPRRWATLAVTEIRFQSPVEWGGYCNSLSAKRLKDKDPAAANS